MGFSGKVRRVPAEDGSFIIDMGGAYQCGVPERSIHRFRLVIRAVDGNGLRRAEDVYWNYPATLPSLIEWVNSVAAGVFRLLIKDNPDIGIRAVNARLPPEENGDDFGTMATRVGLLYVA